MKLLTNKGFSVIYCLVSMIGIVVFLYLNFIHRALTYDDAYSISMIRLPYARIYSLTANDVHPPLYYWMLKAYACLLGDSIFVLRNFSLIGFVGTLLLGYFPIRRIFGNQTSIFFCALLFLLPVSQYLVSDIRMYSWTLFFVLACALYAYDAYIKGGFVNWLKFLLMGICAAYFHNYGLLSILGIYLTLLVFLFRSSKHWKPLIVCGLIFVLLYLPWMGHLLWQLNDVKQSYWIEPLTYKDIFLHIYYIYSPKETWLPFTWYSKYQMMVYLLILIAVQLFLTIRYFKTNWSDKFRHMPVILSFAVFLFPVFVGLFVSFAYTPVMVPRYILCAFGLLILALSIIMADLFVLDDRWIIYAFLTMLLLCTVLRFISGYSYYHQMQKEYSQIQNFVNSKKGTGSLSFVSSQACFPALCRMQVLVPLHRSIVLANGKTEATYLPFSIDTISNIDLSEFILVHSMTYDRSTDVSSVDSYSTMKEFTDKKYSVEDSLHTSEFALYRLKR